MFNFKKNLKLIIFFVFLFSAAFIFFDSNLLMAAPADSLGINAVDNEIILSNRDPRAVIVRIINILLGFLGIIAVSLIIFAGFTWMTSEGNEEKVTKAKGILKGAVIGLAIVLSAWGIVSFVFKKIAGDTSGTGSQDGGNSSFFQEGIGAVGNCTVESVYPEPGQKNVPRNTMIMMTFKEEVSRDTLLANSSICLEQDFSFENLECSNPLSFNLNTEDNKVFVIFPDSLLGNENSNSSYLVYASNDVLKIDEGSSIFNTCSPQYLLWSFEVSNRLDLSPPKIESIFPQPDNEKDQIELSSSLKFAEAQITVTGVPSYFKAAEVVSVSSIAESPSASAKINPRYNKDYNDFTVTIPLDIEGKAQLMSGAVNLGAFDMAGGKIDFTNFFSFEIEGEFSPGNSWNVQISKMVPADKIKVGPYEYTFIDGETNHYNIGVKGNAIGQAEQIYIALNDHPNVDASYSSGVVRLTAKTGGSSGNSIVLKSDSDKIKVTEFNGGADRVEKIIFGDKKDKPMNSTVQINFSEAVNPLTVSGTSEELKDYLRVLKVSKDENDVELTELIPGKFTISSNYKTVEFISSNKCGANSCGDDVFCLPANSNVRVEIVAAELFNCEDNEANCANKNPYSTCLDNICQNEEGKRYPLSVMPANGIMDSSANSLDGNSDEYSYGPVTYYDKNNPDDLTGDSFAWSFWISGKLDLEPPVILKFTPELKAEPFRPIEVIFNKLISADSLRTGRVTIESGGQKVIHNRINILSGQLVGYWIDFENQDIDPVDGDPDRTRVLINHAMFFEGSTYRPQVGSGVKDVYQNCFHPSASIDCVASPTDPSCCDGTPSGGSNCLPAD